MKTKKGPKIKNNDDSVDKTGEANENEEKVEVGKKRGKENKKKNDDEEEVQSPLKKSKSSPVKNGETKK